MLSPHFVSLLVCMCVYLSVRLYVCLVTFLCLSVSGCLFVSVCWSVGLPLYLSVCLRLNGWFLCMFVQLCWSVYLSVWLHNSVYLSICLSITVSVSTCVSACRFLSPCLTTLPWLLVQRILHTSQNKYIYLTTPSPLHVKILLGIIFLLLIIIIMVVFPLSLIPASILIWALHLFTCFTCLGVRLLPVLICLSLCDKC